MAREAPCQGGGRPIPSAFGQCGRELTLRSCTRLEGKHQARAKFSGELLGLDAGAAGPGELETLANVLEGDAVAFTLPVAGLRRNRVAHLDVQQVARTPAANRDCAAARQRLHAVMD